MANQLAVMANRLSIAEDELNDVIKNTIMPSGNVSNSQLVSFLAIANEYKLNPLTSEIYAFPKKGGGIQAVVGVDGWIRVMNEHPQANGFSVAMSDSKVKSNGREVPESCTVTIHRKDKDYATVVTEYFQDCYRNTDPWKTAPVRMLRHKAVIQAIRMAFGLSGIMDHDDAEFGYTQTEKEINPVDEKLNNVDTETGEVLKPAEQQAEPVDYMAMMGQAADQGDKDAMIAAYKTGWGKAKDKAEKETYEQLYRGLMDSHFS